MVRGAGAATELFAMDGGCWPPARSGTRCHRHRVPLVPHYAARRM